MLNQRIIDTLVNTKSLHDELTSYAEVATDVWDFRDLVVGMIEGAWLEPKYDSQFTRDRGELIEFIVRCYLDQMDRGDWEVLYNKFKVED